jgi:Na+/phosphate symporter
MSARPKLPLIARTLLGLGFTVFGLNFFLHFLPQPPMSPDVGAFIGALYAGKILFIIKCVEVAAGLALLGNRFVPLALTLLAPIEIGILATHLVFDPGGIVAGAVLTALTVYLAWSYRSAFAPMLQVRVEPDAATDTAASHQPALA